MKKKLLPVIGAIAVIAAITMSLCSNMEAASKSKQSGVMCQTWEEFLESGVQIIYDEKCTSNEKETNH